MTDWGSGFTSIVGNLIGTDISGTSPLGNGSGVSLAFLGFNRVGGTDPNERNVISGNAGQGMWIGLGVGNLVLGNYLGVDARGSALLANAGGGISIYGTAQETTIGGTTANERNVIGVGPGSAISVGTDFNFIAGNAIGTDATGAAALGGFQNISINGASHTIVQRNLVANSSSGVTIQDGAFNTIRQNLIYGNLGGGIVLSDGANAGISPPVISAASSTSVSGTACAGCVVEVFSDSHNEGQIFEGSTIAGASGAFVLNEGNPLTGPNITATATDISGNTSQFSLGVAAVPLAKNPPPDIAVAPPTLHFAYTTGGAVPAGQSVQVTKTGGGEFEWSSSSSAPWLSATPASDMTPSAVTVSVSPRALRAGTRTGTITFSAAGIASQTVVVTITVKATHRPPRGGEK